MPIFLFLIDGDSVNGEFFNVAFNRADYGFEAPSACLFRGSSIGERALTVKRSVSQPHPRFLLVVLELFSTATTDEPSVF